MSTWSETEKLGFVSQNSTGGAKSFRRVRSMAVSWLFRLKVNLPLFSQIRPDCARQFKSFVPRRLVDLLPHKVWCALLSVPIIRPCLCVRQCSASFINFSGGSQDVLFSM